MKLRIRYFAALREALGTGETVDMPDGVQVAQVRDFLIAMDPAHASALARGKAVRTALDQVLCSEQTAVPEGAEVAFFPPVTGG